MTLPIPVRQIHEDGYITVRYLMPDGSPLQEELPEEMALGAMLHPITAAWDVQYRMGVDEENYPRTTAPANLLHLSRTNPLLFESFLKFMESAPVDQQLIMRRRITGNPMHPSERRPHDTYHSLYRAVLDSAWLLVELSTDALVGTNTTRANQLLGDARRCVEDFDHPHLKAAAVLTWIVQKRDGKRTRLGATGNEAALAFIDGHLHEVLGARHEIARLGSINKDDIERMILTTPALRSGAL